MTYFYSQSSLDKMKNLNKDLVKLLNLFILETKHDIKILETIRTTDQQIKYYNEGKSKTLTSRHLADNITGLSNAFDFVVLTDGKADYKNIWKYKDCIHTFFDIADRNNIIIRSGGDFNQNGTFADIDPNDGLSDFVHIEVPIFFLNKKAEIGKIRRNKLRNMIDTPKYII